LTGLAEAGAKYSLRATDFLQKLNRAQSLRLKYTNFREIEKPDTSNFNFIAEGGRKFGNYVMDLTFNASVTMFHKVRQEKISNGLRILILRSKLTFQFRGFSTAWFLSAVNMYVSKAM
jgi:hypothetical protein